MSGVNSDELEEFKEQFCQESIEALEEAESCFLAIERGEAFEDNFRVIFRTFHSVKGAAGMFGIEKLNQHFHHLENLLERGKKQSAFIQLEIDYFLSGIDAAMNYFKHDKPIAFKLFDPVENPPSEKNEEQSNVTVIQRPEGVDKKMIPGENGHIFLIDDEPEILELIQEAAHECLFSTELFEDGNELLERIKNNKPDLIITDIMMPKMNGVELIKNLHNFTHEIPVICLSGKFTVDICIEALKHGAYGFVEKPYDEDHLKTLMLNATHWRKSNKLIEKSVNFLMYQYAEMKDYLATKSSKMTSDIIDQELKSILKLKRELKNLRKAG